MEQSSIVARRLWQVVRAVFYMLHVRGISKKKLMLDFHLFVHRGKIVGKSFIYQLIHHHHNYSNNNKKRYNNNPRNAGEVEFSCSNTPAASRSGLFHLPKRKANKHQNNNNNNYFHNFDVKEIARVLEALNGNELPYVESPMWSIGKSPAYAPTSYTNQLMRITDSPFPVIEEDNQDGGYMDNKEIDMEAEEFIRKFYEQLRSQQSVPATPVSKRRAN